MPTPANQLDQLVATTFDKVAPALADQITKETALLAALDSKSKVTTDGGLTIRRPLMYALNNTVATYSGYDVLNTTPQGGIGFAEYQWRQMAGSITISGEEERKNSGGPQIINLLQAKIDQLRLSYEDVLNQQLFGDGTGNGGKDFLGLQAIINDSGTLGGIDSANETWWRSVVGAAVNLTTSAGVKGLNAVFNSLVLNGSKPDFEFTTQANFEAYEQLASVNIRFQQTRMADMGFESIAHKTADVVIDTRVPAPGGSGGGYWYFINSDHLEFVQHAQAWLKRLDFQRPYNQDARTALVISMGNLITDMRRGLGVIKVVTV